jgi:hypothetical protein
MFDPLWVVESIDPSSGQLYCGENIFPNFIAWFCRIFLIFVSFRKSFPTSRFFLRFFFSIHLKLIQFSSWSFLITAFNSICNQETCNYCNLLPSVSVELLKNFSHRLKRKTIFHFFFASDEEEKNFFLSKNSQTKRREKKLISDRIEFHFTNWNIIPAPDDY